MGRFAGITGIVTGAASGIGEATARRLFADGGNVVLVDRDEARLARIGHELGDEERTMRLPVDIADRGAVDAMVEQAAARFGTLGILAHCAGITGAGTVMDVDPETWERLHAVNLAGTLNILQAFARRARDAGEPAAIVNVTSIGGLMGVPNRAAYVSSKHAIVGLTREMAMEAGQYGIRVNAVAPGMIRTPLTQYNFDAPGGEESIRRAHPIGRAGEADEIANVILFLLSREASFVTGAIIPVDGGYTAGKGWS